MFASLFWNLFCLLGSVILLGLILLIGGFIIVCIAAGIAGFIESIKTKKGDK